MHAGGTSYTRAKHQSDGLIAGSVKKIAAEYSPDRVVLFGSYASGSAGPESDIDLLIIKETPERFIDRLTTVRRILSDPKRTVPLEMIVLTAKELSDCLAKGDKFITEIVDNSQVLYAA